MKVTCRKNVLYFDKEAADLVWEFARKQHRTFKETVLRALRRGIKNAKKESLAI